MYKNEDVWNENKVLLMFYKYAYRIETLSSAWGGKHVLLLLLFVDKKNSLLMVIIELAVFRNF
jgi:hypothetical protein